MKYFVQNPAFFKNLFKSILWQNSHTSKIIYLTFDDGPNDESTPKILNLLQKLELKATFFCLGNKVQDNNILYNVILKERHIVGNHSFGHLDAWKTTHKQFINDVEEANQWIDSKLFRPPYGRLKWRDYQVLKKKYKIVMWSVMPGDWDAKIDQEQLLIRMKKHIAPGQIYVLHDNELAFQKLSFALPLFVHFARQLGYSFGTL